VNFNEIKRNVYTLSQYSTGLQTSQAAAGYLQAAGYYTMPTTAAQLQQSAALYAAQPTVSQQSATAAGAGADGRLQ
jgi:hypothetical protein